MKAVLVNVDWKKKRILCDFFEGENCVMEAQELRAALRDDFPGNEFAIIPDLDANLAHNFVYQMTRRES